jgi:ABC-type phosphate/phosphonate transport system permease subunit
MNKFIRMRRLLIYLIAVMFIFTIVLYQFDYTNFNGYGPEDDKNFFNKLFHRFYFVTCAMSGMGYGDVSPKTISVKAITITIQLITILSVISELSQYEIYKFF